MISRIRSFKNGFFLLWDAFTLIVRHPRLLLQASLPVLLTLGLYIYGFRFANQFGQEWLMSQIQSSILGQYPIATWITLVIGKIMIVVLAALSFSTVSTILSSPFNDWLSEVAESKTNPPLVPVSGNLFEKLRIVGIDVIKTIASTIASIIMILFSWVPVLNIIAFVIACALLTFQYVSYSQTRRGVTLLQGFRFLVRYPFTCFGFGLSLMIGFSIPFLGCFILPLAVVGGTILCARTQNPRDIH